MIDEKMILEQIADFKRSQKSTNCDYLTGYISALSAVEGMIAEQPKVGEWIPCSERLPEDGQCVLVQVKDKYGNDEDETHIKIKKFDTQHDGYNWKSIGFDEWLANHVIHVWMPLPEAYNGVD